MLEVIEIKTNKRIELINISSAIDAIINKNKVKKGICILQVPHTTAALTINENADPDVVYDIIGKTARLFPKEDNYNHNEGNSDAHIKSSIFGPTLNLIIEDGKILLGIWQGIYFCEFDGPRNRKLFIKIIKEI